MDEVAKRTLTLGQTPLHSFSDCASLSTVKEAKNISNGNDGMQHILTAFKTMISLQREIAVAADECTSALMSGYIREQEKPVWMRSAY